eukprot:6174562-Pleurochrysis_carterae.AAC.4
MQAPWRSLCTQSYRGGRRVNIVTRTIQIHDLQARIRLQGLCNRLAAFRLEASVCACMLQ